MSETGKRLKVIRVSMHALRIALSGMIVEQVLTAQSNKYH